MTNKDGTFEMELGNLIFGNSRGAYHFERGEWQDLFCEFLDKHGFDMYGYIENNDLEKKFGTTVSGDCITYADGKKSVEHQHAFENDTFFIMPYFWGESENICEMPNFIFKPWNFELSWYKYPMRDAYSNKKITFEEFEQMLNLCSESIR